MDFKEIASQMKELEIKASKYDDIKENLEQTMILINEKFNEIQELFSRLSPVMSVKKKYDSWGTTTIVYIEKCYKYLIENEGQEFTMRAIREAVGLGHLVGGSEYAVKKGLYKLPGVNTRNDPNYMKRHLIKYTKVSELPKNMPEFITEIVKNKKVGDIEIEDDNKELLKSVPKKVSHMG